MLLGLIIGCGRSSGVDGCVDDDEVVRVGNSVVRLRARCVLILFGGRWCMYLSCAQSCCHCRRGPADSR